MKTRKNAAAVSLGKLGGRKGWPARDRVLTPTRKRAIAKQGGLAKAHRHQAS